MGVIGAVPLATASVVIGNIKLANNIKVAANATVVKDCVKEGATLIGTPAVIRGGNREETIDFSK